MVSPTGGAVIAYGPRAERDFTRLHNLVFRGGVIHPRYVGVFGYLASHSDGWRLTVERIAADLCVGIDYVKAALAHIEQAGCLIRSRVRRRDGRLAGMVWFVTDLPLQLRHRGITDPAVIRRRVADLFTAWQARHTSTHADPHHDQHDDPGSPDSRAATSQPATAPDDMQASIGTVPAAPAVAEPAWADPDRKKTSGKNTTVNNHHPPARNCPAVNPAAGEDPGDDRLDAAAREMAAALPGPIAPSRRAGLVPDIRRRLADGWTPAMLRAELCTDLGSARSRAAVFGWRLRSLPDQPPATTPAEAGTRPAAVPVGCGRCDGSPGRWVEAGDGRWRHCPTCWAPAA